MIRVGENMSVASGHIFVVVGVDSNQYAPLLCKLCMNIKNIYSGKSEIYFDVHVKMAFVLTLTV